MFINFTISNIIKVVGSIVALLLLIWLSNSVLHQGSISEIKIKISGKSKGRFLTQKAIENILTDHDKSPLVGAKFSIVDFQSLEKKVLLNKRIARCEISRNFGGNLLVEVEERYPLARIVPQRMSQGSFEGLYVDARGQFFPLSENYTEKVILITGAYLIGKTSLAKKSDQELLQFLKDITNDEFWNSNITQVEVAKDKNIQFYTLLGDFKIDFGKPQNDLNLERLKKLMVFYNKIEPYRFEAYNLVSIGYKNQIVCQFKPGYSIEKDSLIIKQ